MWGGGGWGLCPRLCAHLQTSILEWFFHTVTVDYSKGKNKYAKASQKLSILYYIINKTVRVTDIRSQHLWGWPVKGWGLKTFCRSFEVCLGQRYIPWSCKQVKLSPWEYFIQNHYQSPTKINRQSSIPYRRSSPMKPHFLLIITNQQTRWNIKLHINHYQLKIFRKKYS